MKHVATRETCGFRKLRQIARALPDTFSVRELLFCNLQVVPSYLQRSHQHGLFNMYRTIRITSCWFNKHHRTIDGCPLQRLQSTSWPHHINIYGRAMLPKSEHQYVFVTAAKTGPPPQAPASELCPQHAPAPDTQHHFGY